MTDRRPQFVAGRRLWQAMLTEQLHGNQESATALMGTVGDVMELFAALNISVVAIVKLLEAAIPDEFIRTDFIARFLTSFEATNE